MKTKGNRKFDLVPTPSQTVGPYFQIGLTASGSVPCIAGPDAEGEHVKLICTVRDGKGESLPDAMVEIWQSNSAGKYNHPDDKQPKSIDPGFRGFGRLGTDENGSCEFETIKPGRVPGRGKSLQAPHFEVSVFARGVLKRLATRFYFAGEPSNDEDPILALVPKARRSTLLLRPVGGRPGAWSIDVYLSGAKETVFFEV